MHLIGRHKGDFHPREKRREDKAGNNNEDFWTQLLFVFVFNFFSESSFKEKHKYSQSRKEQVKICSTFTFCPYAYGFDKKEDGKSYVSVLKIFKKFHQSFMYWIPVFVRELKLLNFWSESKPAPSLRPPLGSCNL